jgi:hypothetical protein
MTVIRLMAFRAQRRSRAFADKRMGNHAQGLSGERTGDFLPPDFPERSGSFAVGARTDSADRRVLPVAPSRRAP